MWELIQYGRNGTETSVVLNTSRVWTIGRVGCDIIIADKSVSRTHAVLKVQASVDGNLDFILIDRSKYGTFLNGVALAGRQCQVTAGDRITFGAEPGVDVSLQRKPLHIAVSSMDRMTKQRMKTVLALLHGQILESCTESCVALVMVHLVVTAKVICALLSLVPIVTPAFMEDFLEAASRVPFVRPDPNSYLPPLREPRLAADDAVRFLPNEVRRSLFQSKKFYALTREQFTQLESIIRLGQGELFLINSQANFSQHYRQRFTEDQLDLESRLRRVFSQKEACVLHVQRVSSHGKEWQRVVYSALRAIRHRPILESELGFAVVYASTSGYCNPETKCPEKLYEEAGISQAFSVNPFHMDSQLDRPVLEDLSSNAPQLPGLRPFLKRTWDFADLDATNTIESTKSPRETSPKRIRQVTDIVPPVEMDIVPKSICLIADSEPLPKSPSLAGRPPSFISSTYVSKSPKTVQQFIHSRPPTTSMQMSGNGEYPDSLSVTPKIIETRAESFPVSDCSHMLLDEENALLALNSMPALVSSTNKAEHVAIGDTSKLCSQHEDRKLLTPSPSTHAVNIPHFVCADSAKIFEKPSSASDSRLHIVISESPADALQWLAKKTDFIPISDETTECLPKVCAPVERIELRILRSPQQISVTTSYVGINYKNFRKVWPIHFKQASDCGSERSLPRTTFIPLAAYQPQVCNVVTQSAAATLTSSNLEERERVNRLFDEMCQLPKTRMWSRT
ncbi:hypothetical protein EG68_09805 [Paragonimus skrjabini miyazakii]|uniref:FHA domain-containing protein n=1 Tax=Paragonimus skrjabini miyazakii TaxID=59628 RepID=A0A8S9YTK1_9TREM|nr:hypothetical protein EG68_09805 [Paragonimus skrjabini miyazakii]